MKDTETMYHLLQVEKEKIEKKINQIEQELQSLGLEQKTIVIKTIRGKHYYYEQWKKGKKLKYHSLGRVRPGSVSNEEKKIQRKKELQVQYEEQNFLKEQLGQTLEQLKKKMSSKKILNDYTFEVFWKDEITATVRVKGGEVSVSRYCEHPVKQIFASEKMTRYQLNKVLELRCVDRGRPDIQQILEYYGLKEYNPYEIIKRTHGVSYNDYIWIRFPGENLTAKDVLVR